MEQYVLHVTHKCNFRCHYCYEKDRDTTYSTEEIKATCSEIVKCKDQFRVEFIGGEPLLAFDHIKFAYAYIRSRVTLCQSFTISTNGALISESVIEWLRLHNDVDVSISLDGGRYANSLRVTNAGAGTYELVLSNIKRLIQEIGPDRTRVHATATPYNVGLIAHSIDSMYNEGIRHIAYGIIESVYDIDESFADRYVEEMNKVSKKRMSGAYPGLFISEQDGLKPVDDKRTYVYDSEGKQIFESYGRAQDDAITSGEVIAVEVSGRTGELINDIRDRTYHNHQARVKAMENPYGRKNNWDKVWTLEDTRMHLQGMVDELDLHLTTRNEAPGMYIVDINSPWSGIAQGKGVTELASQVSCLAEFAERCALPPGKNSNGAAAGNTRGEAIIQGACEIFERYYMYQSTMEGIIYPTVDPLSIEDLWISELYFWFMKKGYKMYIKHLSDDIPTYGVYWENCKKELNDPTRYSYTVGTSFNSYVALKRAFMEKFQVLYDTEGIAMNIEDPVLDILMNGRTILDTNHLMKGPLVKYESKRHDHLSDDLAELQAILEMTNREISIIDHPHDYLSVVEVRITGMMNMFGEEN